MASELNIDKLDYILKDDLFNAFNKWVNATSVTRSNIDANTFVQILLEKINILFYIKNDSAKSIYDDKLHKAKVFYGISLNKEKLDLYITTINQANDSDLQSKIEQNFLSYLTNIINTYHKVTFPM